MVYSVASINESSAPHKAAHAALSTYGLLCNIVARLPLRDIVAAAGICKFWRDALGDPQVQEALFLRPAKITGVLVRGAIVSDLDSRIPLGECAIIAQLHPFAEKICGPVCLRPAYLDLGKTPSPVTSAEFNHRDGLWREMFITQPPCYVVTISLVKSWMFGLERKRSSDAVLESSWEMSTTLSDRTARPSAR
jgi:hypothetical protein